MENNEITKIKLAALDAAISYTKEDYRDGIKSPDEIVSCARIFYKFLVEHDVPEGQKTIPQTVATKPLNNKFVLEKEA